MTKSAIIIGASGGIGAELVKTLRDEDEYQVTALARSFEGDAHIDITDEASVAAAAIACATCAAPCTRRCVPPCSS